MCLLFIFVSQLSLLDICVLYSIPQTTSGIVNTFHQADKKGCLLCHCHHSVASSHHSWPKILCLANESVASIQVGTVGFKIGRDLLAN